MNTQKIIIICLFWFLVTIQTYAQLFSNPSFEDIPRIHLPPENWEICNNYSTPDLLDDNDGDWYGIEIGPSDGKTFLVLKTRDDSTYEDIQTELLSPLKKNICYQLEIDLAYDGHVIQEGGEKPVTLQVYGAMESCGMDELLAKIGPVSNTNWKTYTEFIVPHNNYNYFILIAQWEGDDPYHGVLLLDNVKLNEGYGNYVRKKLDTIVDLGSRFILRASESESWEWMPKTGLSCYDCKEPVVLVDDSITYYVNIISDLECGDTQEEFKIGYYCETDSFYLPIEMMDTTLWPDESITLFPSFSKSFSWYPRSGLSCYDCPNPKVKTNKPITYYVTLGKSEGCYSVEQFIIHSFCSDTYPKPVLKLDTTVAKYSNVFLKPDESKKYLWKPFLNIDCSDCSKPEMYAKNSETYLVELLDDQTGCQYQQKFIVTVVDCDTLIKQRIFTSLDTTVQSNIPVTLIPSGGVSFYWKPIPGLSCYECEDPIAQIDESQNFTVEVIDEIGCEWEEIFQISISDIDSSLIKIPNVITPNNDQINDVLEIKVLYENSILSIFDIRGVLRYYNKNYDNSWDGRDNSGEQLEQGTYWYIYRVPGFENHFSGFVYIKYE